MDRFDLLALVGLALMGVGLAAIYWPLAPLTVGALLLGAAVYRAAKVASYGHIDGPVPPAEGDEGH